MMKHAFLVVVLTAATSAPELAQHHHHETAAKPAYLCEGLGNYHHPIATKIREAQHFFDQG